MVKTTTARYQNFTEEPQFEYQHIHFSTTNRYVRMMCPNCFETTFKQLWRDTKTQPKICYISSQPAFLSKKSTLAPLSPNSYTQSSLLEYPHSLPPPLPPSPSVPPKYRHLGVFFHHPIKITQFFFLP